VSETYFGRICLVTRLLAELRGLFGPGPESAELVQAQSRIFDQVLDGAVPAPDELVNRIEAEIYRRKAGQEQP
jgi:hypothetical protein